MVQVAADADLQERACTPLRPGYAQDVRDAALAAANATDKLVSKDVTFSTPDSQAGYPALMRLHLRGPCAATAQHAVCLATYLPAPRKLRCRTGAAL